MLDIFYTSLAIFVVIVPVLAVLLHYGEKSAQLQGKAIGRLIYMVCNRDK